MNNKQLITIVWLPLLLVMSILPQASGTELKWHKLVPDYWPTTGWRTSTPEAQGMTSSKLQEMEAFIDEVVWGIGLHSVVVIRNGYLVYEYYFNPLYHENRTSNIYSCTKSVTSALIGIAISAGDIGSVEDRLLDFFPNRTIANLDARKQAITVEHLLTMTSGLPWDESTYPYAHPENDWYRMTTSEDWVQFMLDRPMISDPREEWRYNTGGSHLLSAILTQATGIPTSIFAEEHLFGPLGITDFLWSVDPHGIANGGSSLQLTPRDMAKFGYLFLNNGTWDGEQIIPTAWVVESTESYSSLSAELGYGYQWWIHPDLQAYAAHGYLNQHIYVFSDLDMVVVFTAGAGAVEERTLLEDYILAATSIPSTSIPVPNIELLTTIFLIAVAIIVPVTLGVVYWMRKRK